MAWNPSSLEEFPPPLEGSPSIVPDHRTASAPQIPHHNAAAGPSQFAFGQREGESDSEYCYRAAALSRRNSSAYDGSEFVPRRLSVVQHSYASSTDHDSQGSPTYSTPPSSSFSTFPLPSPLFLPKSYANPSNDRTTQLSETWSETIYDETGSKLAYASSDQSGQQNGKSWFTAMQDSFLEHQATVPLSQLPPRPHSENRQTPAFDYRSSIHDSSPHTSPDRPLIPYPYSTGPPATGGAKFERSVSLNSQLASALRRSSLISPTAPSSGLRERKALRLNIQVPQYDHNVAMNAPHTAPMVFGNTTDSSFFDPLSTHSIMSQFPLPPTTNGRASAPPIQESVVDVFGQELYVPASRSSSVSYHGGRLSRHGSANPTPHHSRHPSYSPQSSLQALPLSSVDENFSSWNVNASEGQGFDGRSYPSSAPAWKTTFQLPPSHYDIQVSSDSQFLHSGSQEYQQQYAGTTRRASYAHYDASYTTIDNLDPTLSFPSSPSRPHSAPTNQQPPGLVAIQQMDRHRGSSVDSMAALRSDGLDSHLPRHYPSSPAAHTSAPSSIPIQQHSSFSPNVSYPSPAGSHPSPPVVAAALPSSKSPKKPKKSPTVPKPPKTPKSKQGAGGLAMFINFTASDSAKLLAGVAPSGSSAKRKREEEAEALERGERERDESPSKGRRISRGYYQ